MNIASSFCARMQLNEFLGVDLDQQVTFKLRRQFGCFIACCLHSSLTPCLRRSQWTV